MFSIKIVGRDNLENSLDRLEDMEGNVIKPGRRKWLQGLRSILKSEPYPPKTPIQTYIRTGDLANRWAVTGESITNSKPASEFVVGDDQADVHKGRWWTGRQVIEREVDGLGDVLIKEIEGQWH